MILVENHLCPGRPKDLKNTFNLFPRTDPQRTKDQLEIQDQTNCQFTVVKNVLIYIFIDMLS